MSDQHDERVRRWAGRARLCGWVLLCCAPWVLAQEPVQDAPPLEELEARAAERPEDAANLRALAPAYLAAGRTADALAAATRLIGLTDELPGDRLLLARASLAEADRLVTEGERGGYVRSLLADVEQSARLACADAALSLEARVFLAHAQFRQGAAEAARATLGEVLAEEPEEVDALALRGYLTLFGERPEEAVADLERAAHLAPERVDVRVHWAMALAHRSAAEAAAVFVSLAEEGRADERLAGDAYRTLAADPAQAERSLRAVCTVRPEDAEACFWLGRALADGGRHAEAIAAYDRSLALLPDDATVLAFRGDARGRANDFSGLVDDLLLVVRADVPERVWAVRRLQAASAWFAQQGNWETVARIGQVLIETDPDDPDVHGNLGLALMRLDRVDEADALFRAAVESFPDSVRLINDHGLLLEGVGRYQEAEERFARAADLGSLDGLENLAVLRLRLGDVASARERFQAVLGRDPARVRSVAGYARTLLSDALDSR
ncbi:MAG: tetratricopeptide repeat protein [Planctomycetes bacterium]|nr:tetratricopeptide repeat protein [Planctomycetota bacterium]